MIPVSQHRSFDHPADDWYQVEVSGEHLNGATGVLQVIDPAAVTAITNTFNREAIDYKTQHGEDYPGMLIDIEHFKHDPNKESRAYGWLTELANRNGVLFGKIRWTAIGRAAVDGGEYRFFSTEYFPGDTVRLKNSSPVTVRPVRLSGLSLTNTPNNKGGRPITNSDRAAAVDQRPANAAAASEQFLSVANRIKNTRRCSFTEAWNEAREIEPGLFAKMSGLTPHNQKASSPALQEREIQFAATRVRDLALNRSRDRGVPFDRAWGEICNEFGDLNAKMNGRIFNRDSMTVSPEDMKRAEKRVGDVIAAIQEDQGTPDRGNSTHDQHLYGVFAKSISHLVNSENMTVQQALDHLKATEPILWARSLLAWPMDDAKYQQRTLHRSGDES